MVKCPGAYLFPSAYTFFESMHSTDKTPARIANASFGTKYRPYPISCRFFDDALYGTYQGDLFVTSAGNSGLDDQSLESIGNTIGNPASCKNTLAGELHIIHLIIITFLTKLSQSNLFYISWCKSKSW